MKKILLSLSILFAAYDGQTQAPALNKQQTVDYIEKLYKANYNNAEYKIVDFLLDGKILRIKDNKARSWGYDLSTKDSLQVCPAGLNYDIAFVNIKNEKRYFLTHIQLETDAIRLKKALEHLIELVKAEKSTDPFDN